MLARAYSRFLKPAITLERGICNFDDEPYVVGPRMAVEVVTGLAPHHHHIGFRLAIVCGDRFLRIDIPLSRHKAFQDLADQACDGAVRWVFRHFGNQPPFQQFHRIIVGQNPSVNHGMILVDAQRPDHIGRHRGTSFDAGSQPFVWSQPYSDSLRVALLSGASAAHPISSTKRSTRRCTCLNTS